MQAAKQIRLSRNVRRSLVGAQLVELADRVHPLEAELGLGPDRRDRLDGGERLGPLVVVGQVGVEQRQVELHVQRLLEQLAGQEQPGLGGVDVLVQVEHEVVGDDRVAGGEEGDEAADQVALGREQLAQVDEVVGEVDLLDRPRVADRGPVALVELRVAHRPQRQVEARVEDRSTVAAGRGAGRGERAGRVELDERFGDAHVSCTPRMIRGSRGSRRSPPRR